MKKNDHVDYYYFCDDAEDEKDYTENVHMVSSVLMKGVKS